VSVVWGFLDASLEGFRVTCGYRLRLKLRTGA